MRICEDCKIQKAAKHRKICLNCKNKRYREKNPFQYSYNNLKSHAKARGKYFDLTFEEFKKFAIETDYINKKGIGKNSLHIDRIKEYEGYTKNNIQVLENHLNVKKYVNFISIGPDGNKIFKTMTIINNIDSSNEDCPF